MHPETAERTTYNDGTRRTSQHGRRESIMIDSATRQQTSVTEPAKHAHEAARGHRLTLMIFLRIIVYSCLSSPLAA
eukprot:1023285-Pleurochrysis_carterae.AAC.1